MSDEVAKKRRRGHGEGSVYQRKDGRWTATIDLGWEDGKRKRKTYYGDTQREVLAKMRAGRTEQREGRNLTLPTTPLETFLNGWLVEKAGSELAPKTIDQYQRLARLHVIPVLGKKPLDRITTTDVTRWLRAKKDGGLSAKTCNHLRGLLRNVLNDAVKAGLIVRNPVMATEPIRGESRTIAPLERDEIERLFVAIAGRPDEILIRLTLSLGLRIGETLGLRWDDVDLAGDRPWSRGRPCLRIEWTLQRVAPSASQRAPHGPSAAKDGPVTTPTVLALKRPKTPKSRRVLPIPAQIVTLLENQRERQQDLASRHAPLWVDQGYVFTTELGTPIEPRNALRSFHAACERATITRRRLHDLRHTAVTALRAQGVPMKVVSELLGHSQLATTADLYGHVLSDTLADATDRLALAWGQNGGASDG